MRTSYQMLRKRSWLYGNKPKQKKKFKPTPSPLPEYAEELRSKMTNEELKLWPTLKDLGFLSQVILCGFIADFAHHGFRVIVELDGAGHFTPSGKAYDARRNESLKARGWTVLHFENRAIRETFPAVVNSIKQALR